MNIKQAWTFMARRFRNDKCPIGICRELDDLIFSRKLITMEQYGSMNYDLQQYVARFKRFHNTEKDKFILPVRIVEDGKYNSAHSRMRASICTHFANGKTPPLVFDSQRGAFALT